MAVLEAIGSFFVLIGKGIGYFFYGIWCVIKTIAVSIAKAVAYVVMLAVRYFLVYLPVLVIGVYVILWVTGAMLELDWGIYGIWEIWDYEWGLTVTAVEWMENAEYSFFTALPLGLFHVLLVVLFALIDFLVIYIIVFGFGSLIIMAIQFVIYMGILFVLPAGAVVYSFMMLKNNSDSYNSWFHILCLILTIAGALLHYICTFANM